MFGGHTIWGLGLVIDILWHWLMIVHDSLESFFLNRYLMWQLSFQDFLIWLILSLIRRLNVSDQTMPNNYLFIDFFNERGVVHQFSCVDRPQQFSRGQKHKHLLNVALALYFHSRVPIQFWSDCVLTATFLKTGLPLHYWTIRPLMSFCTILLWTTLC